MTKGSGRSGAEAPSGCEASPSAASSTASSQSRIPNAVRRTWKSFDSAPKDGTPFVIGNYMRFNPRTGCQEILFGSGGNEEVSRRMDKAFAHMDRAFSALQGGGDA